MRSVRPSPPSSLRLDRLEDRTTPAQFNVPWADPMHLTLSFAPDGTPALDAASSSFATFDAQMPREVWQTAILRAFQTWLGPVGVNIGVVADGGQAFGVTGPPQGDPRFGDIRIGALPMADALAEATPPDATLVGTLAGDIYFNSLAGFTPDTLYAVALHEVGHALGLPPNQADPTSVMYDTFTQNTALNPADVAAVRALYGVRPADPNEGSNGNGTISNATRIKFHSEFDGSTPLVVYGDVTTAADADVFYLPVLDTYSGPVTVRVQTAGVSLLAPKLTVTDRNGAVLAAATGSGSQGDTLTVTLPQVAAGGKYYLKVEAAPAAFAVGRYGVGVTFDGLLKPSPLSLDAVLRGPYDSLSPQDIIGLFKNPSGAGFNDDDGTNDTAGKATLLTTAPGFLANTRFKTTAGIGTPTDVDFYHVKAPSTPNNAAVVLTATVRAVAPNGAAQRIELYNAAQVRIPATILANGNGTFTVQAANLPSNTDYYVRVGGGPPGNYQLDIGFGSKATTVETFSAGTAPANGRLESPLYVAETQVFGFTLTATGPAGASVQMAITDLNGNVLFALTGPAGDTVSGVTGFLPPGEYRVRMTVAGAAGPVGFTVRGTAASDPIGPQPGNSAAAPQYQDPNTPGGFVYPGGVSTFSPFLFGLWSVI